MPPRLSALLLGASLAFSAFASSSTTVTVDLAGPGKNISPELVGIFFEDINYAADGGLYAELVQNRSFEYRSTEQSTWNNLSFWELNNRGGAKGGFRVMDAFPVHPNNPHYAILSVETPGEGVALVNAGFDGIPVQAGKRYLLNFFASEVFFGKRWVDVGKSGELPLTLRLESKDGTVLAEASVNITERQWKPFSATLTATKDDPAARLVLLAKVPGGIALDEVSLFPEDTFHGRKNGLRRDLAQMIADIKPRFMRFPGGCLVHGNGLGNLYRWQDTIGPIEQRKQQANQWGYHQTVGLGYFEYFQFCEDIGAQALPVVAAGVCCQNSGNGIGQAGMPLEELDAYIQDVLNLIEWANGPADSTWGAKRAAAGHPAPFGLKYLGVGNEDQITPVFRERYERIQKAIQAKHPEITIIGTVGPFPDGEDFDKGWQIARELKVPMVDEHYYKPPQWFWDKLRRYDSYDRSQSKVYVGEYAAHDDKRRSTLRSALAEAAFLTSLERNGDVVHMASYAPLLARRGHTQWTPDLIYFDATKVYPTLNYTVQKLFGNNAGDRYHATTLAGLGAQERFSASTVSDTKTGDLIIKLVNGEDQERALTLQLSGAKGLPADAELIVFTGTSLDLFNEDKQEPHCLPTSSRVPVSATFSYTAPARSLSILRLHRP